MVDDESRKPTEMRSKFIDRQGRRLPIVTNPCALTYLLGDWIRWGSAAAGGCWDIMGEGRGRETGRRLSMLCVQRVGEGKQPEESREDRCSNIDATLLLCIPAHGLHHR